MPNWATSLITVALLLLVMAGLIVLAALTDASPWLALPGTALLTAAMVFSVPLGARVRRWRMAQAAARHGWSLETPPPGDVPEALGGFPLLRKGAWRVVSNVLRGSVGGVEVLVADVEWGRGHGRYARATWQTVLVIEAPEQASSWDARPAPEAGWTVERSHGRLCVYRVGWNATAARLTSFVARAAAAAGVGLGCGADARGSFTANGRS